VYTILYIAISFLAGVFVGLSITLYIGYREDKAEKRLFVGGCKGEMGEALQEVAYDISGKKPLRDINHFIEELKNTKD